MLELTKKGFSRESSYKIVQKHCRHAWNNDISLFDSLKSDKNLYGKIGEKDLKKIFDLKLHTKKIGIIFNRVLK